MGSIVGLAVAGPLGFLWVAKLLNLQLEKIRQRMRRYKVKNAICKRNFFLPLISYLSLTCSHFTILD